MSEPPPPRPIPAEPIVVGGYALGFWALYAFTFGAQQPNLFWYNFVFDADPSRVLGDALSGQHELVFARHPLFALVIGAPTAFFRTLLGPEAGVLAITSLLAALGVAGSVVVFRRLTGSLVQAALLALLFGLSATVWVLASIPETFAVNAACIVAVFLLHRPEFAQPSRERMRFALNGLLAALAMGVAVPNIVYPTLGMASNLRSAQPDFRRRARVFLGFVAVTCAALLLLGGIQKALFPVQVPRAEVLSAPFRAVGNDAYLRLDRPFVASEVGNLVRAFAGDNLVARPAIVLTERLPDGPYSLLQYAGPPPALYWIAIAGLLALVGVLLWRGSGREVIKEPLAQLALALLAYNLVFHYFYRANGQPFIFAVHAVFPLLVLLAACLGRSRVRFRAAGLGVVVVLVALNNLGFVGFVRLALSVPCDRPVGNVCAEWRARSDDLRFTEGVPNFMSSADYPLELGRMALEERRLDESLPLLVRSIELDRRYLLPRLYLAAALVEAGKLDDAIAHLQRSLQEFPGNPRLTLLLDDAMRRRGPR